MSSAMASNSAPLLFRVIVMTIPLFLSLSYPIGWYQPTHYALRRDEVPMRHRSATSVFDVQYKP